VCVTLAVLSPRSLPATMRAAIWSALLLAVIALAANLGRIMPPDRPRALAPMYQYDRLCTVTLAVALTALWFRPSRLQPTLAIVGCLPMLTLTMIRRLGPSSNSGDIGLTIWGTLALFGLATQSQRLTQPRPAGIPAAGPGEYARRTFSILLALTAAYVLTPPIAATTRIALDRIFGWMAGNRRDAEARFSFENLALASPPAAWAGHFRPMLAIEAPSMPGYLRESVYLQCQRNSWVRRDGSTMQVLNELPDRHGGQGQRAYQVAADQDAVTSSWWTVHALSPARLAGFCLPGHAAIVAYAGEEAPKMDSDGIVILEDQPPPSRFEVGVAPTGNNRAFNWPRPPLPGEYLSLPALLAPSVTNWVAACAGLAEADSPVAAMQAVVRDFQERFTYELGVNYGRVAPLDRFMTARTGHCTLFASAATLMLRQRGIPARMVSGYLCTERHPWTGQWTVRARDGHAWCEAWDEQRASWVLVEATPANGLPSAHPPPGRLRLAFETLTALWRSLLETLRQRNPLLYVALAGVWLFGFLRHFLTSPLGIGCCACAAAYWWWRRRRHRRVQDEAARLRAALTRAMRRSERRLTPAHLRRAADEPWTAWARRVTPQLPPERATRLRALAETYQDLRYRETLDVPRARAWLTNSRRGHSRAISRAADGTAADSGPGWP
ncbi:MAG: transglutaminase-like domain-containing protein, partial [Kiritimatiellae bacterium]|nr:transglutaminase-like domain-containing protein [Kiritimatiellia bacterium]